MEQYDEYIVTKEEHEMRLDRFLRKLTGMTQSYIERSLRLKRILLDHKATKSKVSLKENQVVSLHKLSYKANVTKTPRLIDFNLHSDTIKILRDAIIYEDEWIIALNKPNGIAVQGGSKVPISIDDLSSKLTDSDVKPRIVHRLDRETSGVLLLARSGYMARCLTESFCKRKIVKIYHALVVGKPEIQIIDIPLSSAKIGNEYQVIADHHAGKKSVTKINNVVNIGNSQISLIEIELLTGRKHQIRAHLAHLGHPIIGDKKYNMSYSKSDAHKLSDDLCLHASSIDMKGWPKIEAELPLHIQQVISQNEVSSL